MMSADDGNASQSWLWIFFFITIKFLVAVGGLTATESRPPQSRGTEDIVTVVVRTLMVTEFIKVRDKSSAE